MFPSNILVWSLLSQIIYILQESQIGVLVAVLTQVFMEYLINDGKQVFKSLRQMDPSQLSTNPESESCHSKAKCSWLLSVIGKLKKANFKSSMVIVIGAQKE